MGETNDTVTAGVTDALAGASESHEAPKLGRLRTRATLASTSNRSLRIVHVGRVKEVD